MANERDTPHRTPPSRSVPRPRDEPDDKPAEAEGKPENKGKTVKVTYHPEQGDPIETEWHGIKFVGNIAKEVAASRNDLIEAAKTNPWFSVEGTPRAKKVKPTADKVTPPGRDVDPVALDDSKMVEDC